MRDFAIVFVHLIVTLVRLARPGGLRSVVAESVLVRVAVGISVARYPPHRSPRAALLHEMCSSTFHAICGHENYVAPSEQLRWNEWPASFTSSRSRNIGEDPWLSRCASAPAVNTTTCSQSGCQARRSINPQCSLFVFNSPAKAHPARYSH